MNRVLVSDRLSQEGLAILEREPDLIQVDVQTGLSEADLCGIIGDYHGMIVRSSTKVTAPILEKANNLQVIGRAGIGVDNIDVEAASRKGVIVMNTPTGNAVTTAEHTIAMMMAIARKIPQADASMKRGEWEKKRFTGVEIYNKILGVIGLGNIGSIVADRAQGLGMRVIAYDPFVTEEKAEKMRVELVTLDQLYERSDFVTVHTPLTPETKGLIGKEALGRMKPTAILINCARGGIVDEAALYEALKSNRIAGAALDVYTEEPPKENPLGTLEQVVTTPHLGAATNEAQRNVAIDVASQIVEFFKYGTIKNAVNFPSMTPEAAKTLQPYSILAEKIGSLQTQLALAPIEEVEIEYSGDVTDYDSRPLTMAALKGLLAPICPDVVNYVNASVVAKERGIRVVESKASQPKDFASVITLTIKTRKGKRSIAGGMFGRKEPRIVKVDNYFLEAIPSGDILFLENWDKPGVIGDLGSLLGKNGVNVARMQIGRDQPGGHAISMLNIDQPVSKKLLEEIRNLPNIISATQVQL